MINKKIGNLIVIVGASGVGKDTLLNEVKTKLNNFYFVKRYITRVNDNNEDNIYLSEIEFQRKVAKGFFIINWEAHGLSYGIPKHIKKVLNVGTNVVFNGSRNALKQTQENFPNVKIICITASKKIIKERLILRNRENLQDIEKRINRKVIPLPSNTTYVYNNSNLETGIKNLISALNPQA